MIKIRQSKDRGMSKHDWLQSYHTFSFANYQDPAFMGFGKLRVINEDTVQPAMGFGTHQHHDMEIISYVISGVMAHKDSLGTGSQIKRGEIQRMTAGSGVEHSEFNASQDEPLHFLQLWIIPNKANLSPSYEQKNIPNIKNQWILIGAEQGDDYTVTIHQDVKLFVAFLSKDHSLDYAIKQNRRVWIQLIKGKIKVNEQTLEAGDGAALVDERDLQVVCMQDAEFLLFDLAN